jgi:hypothetical protein
LLLRLLMYDPDRRNMPRRGIHPILKRICGSPVAARLLDIHTTNLGVYIRMRGWPPNSHRYSLLVTLSDSVGAVKRKFLSLLTYLSESNPDESWDYVTDPRWFEGSIIFADRQLPDHLSLAECSIMPHDTIEFFLPPDPDS